jgi:hypothetical protein
MRDHAIVNRLGPHLLAMAICAAACSSGETCVGGLVVDGGMCIPKCDPALCVTYPGDGGPVLTDGGVPVNACVANSCMLRCASHKDCTYPMESCLSAPEDGTDGGTVNVCQPNGAPEGYLSSCASGECPGDLLCVGKSGDADAYCTVADCTSDADCPGGLYCGVTRDPHQICGTTKGNNAFCGTTNDACLQSSDLSADGPLMEGSFCVLRRTCLKRTECAPCTTDLDCSGADTRCTTVGGEQRCAAPCGTGDDCPIDESCDQHFCVPKFGACVGSGEGFCNPCFDDRDCGGPSSTWICEEYRVGSKACLDTSPCDPICSTSCPNTPVGPPGTCYIGPNGLDGYLPMCYPYDPSPCAGSELFTCW